MKIEGALFVIATVFYGIVAAAYWFLSGDPIGTTVLALTGVLGFIVALIARVRPTSWAFLIISIAVVSVSTAGYAFAIWAADGIELARHLLPVTALLPLAVAVLPTAFLSRPSGTQHS